MKSKLVTIVRRVGGPDSQVTEPTGQRQLWFWCQGCKAPHAVNVAPGPEPAPLWTWDGNLDLPTISPSVRVTYEPGNGNGRAARQCHIFLKAGVIEFLSDCTHHTLGGQKLPLEDLPDWLAED